MKLYYYRHKKGNFGDDLNAWLWPRLLPNIWDDDDRLMLCGIGTLIGNNMSETANWIVFGSGVGYLPPPKDFGSARWNILCVRGPLSAQILGIPREKAITDGAALLSLLPEYVPVPESERRGTVFMPHHLALETGEWRKACELAGVEFLDPERDDRETIARLRHAKLVIADAMHAAIVSDTLRVPWVPVVTSPEINTFKWMDWTSSMEMPYSPLVLPPSSRREAVRSWFLKYRGKHHFLPNATAQDVLDLVVRYRHLNEQSWWPLVRKPISAASKFCTTAMRMIGHTRHSRQTPSRQGTTAADPFIESAVIALHAASQATSYLSSDRVFRRKKDELSACLVQLSHGIKSSGIVEKNRSAANQ